MTRPKLYLIDGHSFAYRAFFALPPTMMTTDGQPTNAVYGFSKMLFGIIEEKKPAALAVAFDLPQPTFRHEMYAGYKAQRPPSPEEFRSQVPLIKAILRAADIQIFEAAGYEADDVLGTLAYKAVEAGYSAVIVTGDRDALQLVNEHIHVLMPQKGLSEAKEFDLAAVEEKYSGLKPAQIIDLKALMGDPSDNIPGVPGVGEKTAIALLQEFGTVAGIKERLADIPRQAIKAKISANLDSLDLSYRLAAINTAVPGDYDLAACKAEKIDLLKALPLCRELQLASLVKKYEKTDGAAAAPGQEGLFAGAAQPQSLDPAKALRARLMKYLLNPERAIAPEEITQNDIDALPQYEQLLREQGMLELYTDIELPLAEVLAEMQAQGVKLDVGFLARMSSELGNFISGLEQAIYGLAGAEFNLNSPKQLGEIFFEKLKLPALKKNKTGYSTDAGVLEELAYDHAIARKLLDYRQLAKLKSTYVDALPLLIDPQDGKLHANFNQTVTATGRLSSSEPNLQNIPIRSEAGKKIRQAFIPERDGQVLLSADYSQIELRILAHYADEKNLQEAFRQGLDIHKATAAKVFGVPLDAVTAEQRSQSKAVNFGIAYGMSARKLAQTVGIPQTEAQNFIANYFATYPGIKKYIDSTLELAHRQGYVTTLLGRRRYFKEINAHNKQTAAMAERAAINMPIQGTSADFIKIAMVRIARALAEQKFQAKMILQVHDELVFDLPEKEAYDLECLVKKIMTSVYTLKVPLVVNTAVGKNWLEAK
ncbi:MAG: DNA polymerase I [Candidatus Margulisbacteria bacterium]|jgi:DNA polymerase-1|nr:DNA polymerase I [Candidatus Margulisiibacteriota bacterium]